MLDAATKRNIDAARDVLVGKVPDPKAQVEQITTALIYKFMDDLDQESVELGGQPKFFTGEYEKYGWTKLVDTRLTGEGRLDLYVQAITSMDRNPNLPQLFRDIFKGAFLPYNDPQTLSFFLKEINKFTYSHSEELGNAFEYLLSVLGSQGDAGQFRTPRHIIDFMVSVVHPKKHETILDPACGTAGFLISAYKHIRKHNSSNYQPDENHKDAVGDTAPGLILAEKETYTGDQLTPDERRRLTENIQGYDISPDMVRLSLVNLYLHGFTSPRISEYDTLTSEKNWNDSFDVILANPPFMSPKGGIRPHKRFQVQAKRSEVLFVDYILEHLNLSGRAGVIVPEGIIFKSDNAYKALRRLLLDDGLFAVVSLPPGVFNPYSGVKTSVLFFDNQLAQRSDELLFVKVSQDGFDLGAQRRKIAADDLPEALRVLHAWHQGQKLTSPLALWVSKQKIAEGGDYNLSGERYREVAVSKNQKWPLVELGNEELFIIESGGTPDSKNLDYWNGNIPWITLVDLPQKNLITIVKNSKRKISEKGLENSSARLLPENSIIVSTRATIGRIGINSVPLATNQGFKNIIIKDFSKAYSLFIAYILTKKVSELERMGTGGTYKEVSKSNFAKIKIPLPTLDVQRDIVEQIAVKQAAIDGARAVIANLEKERRFFGRELQDNEEVEWVELGEVCEKILSGGTPSTKVKEYWEGNIPWITSADILDLMNAKPKRYITRDAINNSATNLIPRGNVIVVTRVGLGKLFRNDFDVCISQDSQGLIIKPELILSEFLVYILQNEVLKFKQSSQGSTIQGVTKKQLSSIRFPLPSITIQKKLIFEERKKEQIVQNNFNLINFLQNKMEIVISRVNNEY